jgi:hypothetical protein
LRNVGLSLDEVVGLAGVRRNVVELPCGSINEFELPLFGSDRLLYEQ